MNISSPFWPPNARCQRKLVCVPYQNHVAVAPGHGQHVSKQLGTEHGGLVDDAQGDGVKLVGARLLDGLEIVHCLAISIASRSTSGRCHPGVWMRLGHCPYHV